MHTDPAVFKTTERVIVIYLIATGCISCNQKRIGSKIEFSFKHDIVSDRMDEYRAGKPMLVDYRLVIFAENWFNTIIHEI